MKRTAVAILTGIAVLLSGVTVPAVAAASAPASGLAVVATAAPNAGKKFTPQYVRVKVPTKWVYNAGTGKTAVLTSKPVKKVYAKSNGSSVFVKMSGTWRKVPYVFFPKTGYIYYSEKQRRALGIGADRLGAPRSSSNTGNAVSVNMTTTPTTPTPPPWVDVTPVPQPTPPPGTGPSTPTTIVPPNYSPDPAVAAGYGVAVANAHNAYRSSRGLGGLQYCPALERAAQGWANYMADNNFLGHTGNGGGPHDRARAVGYMGTVHENALRGGGNINEVNLDMDSWKSSSAHNSNMLRPEVTHIGVAAAYSDSGVGYVAVELGYGGSC